MEYGIKMSNLMLNNIICLEEEKAEWLVYEPRILPTTFQISKNIDE